MTKHTHGLSVTRIAGEGIDADYVEQPREFCDPSHPICQGCDEESDDDRGYCSRCEDFVSNQPTPKPLPPVRGTVRQIMERIQSRERFEWHISDDGKSGRIAA